MKLKLPRSLHMRIMLSIALLQLVMVGAFSVIWIVGEVGDELANRQSVAHKILSLTIPSVERALYQQTTNELPRYLNRAVADSLIGGITIKDPSGKILFEQMKPAETLHPIAAWFKLGKLKEGISTHLVRGDLPNNLLQLAEGQFIGTQIGGKL